MSQTLTISDALYSRLDAAVRRRGLGTVEQLLESMQGTEDDEARFRRLAERWKKETAHVSNIGKKAMHPAYQEIIGMGNAAAGYLLAELRREPDDWFWAVHAITGANPIPVESRGYLQKMIEAWLNWGSEQGYQV